MPFLKKVMGYLEMLSPDVASPWSSRTIALPVRPHFIVVWALRALKNWRGFNFQFLLRFFFMVFNRSVTFSILLERWTMLLFIDGLSASL